MHDLDGQYMKDLSLCEIKECLCGVDVRDIWRLGFLEDFQQFY